MVENIGKKTKDGLYWSVSLKISYEIVKFANSILVARILDPKDFGIVSIATMAIYYSNTFTNFGFNQALVQRKDIDDSHINTVFSFDMVISIIIGIGMFLSAGVIADFFNSPESESVVKVLSIVFLLTTLHDLPYVLLRRAVEFKLISIVDMVRELSMSFLTLLLAYFGMKYWSIVWGHVIPLFFAAIYLMYKIKKPLRLRYTHKSLMDLFSFSSWSFIQMQIYFLSSRIDRIFVGRYLDTTMLGLYEKAKSLSQMPSESLGDKINTVFFSSFSRVQEDREDIQRYFNKGIIIITSINFPIYFGLFAIANIFVLVLLGEKWRQIVTPFQIMALAGIFATMNGLISALAVGTGHLKSFTAIFTFSVILLFVGCGIAAPHGIEAVAWIFVLYTVAMFMFSYILVKYYYGLKLTDLLFCVTPALISSSLMYCVLYFSIINYLFEVTAFNLVTLIILGAVTYSASMFLIPSKHLESVRGPIKYDIQRLIGKLINKNTG